MSYSFDNEYVSLQATEFYEPVKTPEPSLQPETQTRYIPLTKDTPSLKLRLIGSMKNPSQFSKIELMAPNPIQRLMNYYGSALPYPCAQIAFDNTPNYVDLTRLVDGATTAPTDFNVVFDYPNGYYTADHSDLVAPSIFFALTPISATIPIYVRFELPNPHPLKTLTYRPGFRKGPEFYAKKEALYQEVPENQEMFLRTIGGLKRAYDLA
jgi:hypothetical protein